MESKVNFTVVGIFVVMLSIAIIAISLWLTVGLERQNYKTFQVYMNESVAGLNDQAPVKYNGVTVGYVSDMQLNFKNPKQVILTLKIDNDIPITQDTEAVLMSQGFTGIAYIGLRGGDVAKPLKRLKGQKYPVIKAAPSFMVRLDTALESLTDNMKSLSNSVEQLMSQENLKSIHDTLTNLDKVTTVMASNSRQIDASIKSLNVFLNNSAKVSKQFPEIMDQIEQSTKAIKNMSVTIDQTSKSLKTTVNKSNDTLQQFSDQVMPQAYEALNNINQLSIKLQSFANKVSKNPNALISGQKQPKLGPGEK